MEGRRLRVLVAPAHWGGDSHRLQLVAIARALVARGHRVTYVTGEMEPPELHASSGMEVVVAKSVVWPADLDLRLAVRMARGEPELEVRRTLVRAACDAAESFFEDASVQPILRREFDVALVDNDSLSGLTLVDALFPLPHARYLTYPSRRGGTHASEGRA